MPGNIEYRVVEHGEDRKGPNSFQTQLEKEQAGGSLPSAGGFFVFHVLIRSCQLPSKNLVLYFFTRLETTTTLHYISTSIYGILSFETATSTATVDRDSLLRFSGKKVL